MYINTILSSNNQTTFNANLKIIREERFTDYIKKNKISNSQLELLKDKFSKASKNIKGELILDFGTYSPNGYWVTNPGYLKYSNEKYSDLINANLYDEDLTSDMFVKKLVKMLKVFQKREKYEQEIKKLNARIYEIEQMIPKEEKSCVEKLFGRRKLY